MSEHNVVETLRELGPEKVVDGLELCPCCDGLSPGISMDGETRRDDCALPRLSRPQRGNR